MSDQHWSQMMLPRERIEQLESVNRELRKENEARRTQLKETEEKGRVLMDMCRDLKARARELETMVKVFRGCIETGLMPKPGSPCQRKIFDLVGESEGAVKAGGEK